MGGKVYDRQPLVVDRDPSKTLAVEVGKLNKPNPIDLTLAFGNALLDYGLDAFKNVTGIDLKSWTAFLDNLPGFDAGKIISGIFTGGLIPGLDASKIVSGTFGAGLLQPIIDAVSQGFGGTTGLGFGGLQSFLGGLSFAGISFDDLLGLIPGIGTGLSGSAGLGSVFTDWLGILGNPTGLGTGTTTLPGIGSIPLLGGLLSGSTLLSSLIPGLDASKIISGQFSQSQVIDLVEDLSLAVWNAGSALQGVLQFTRTGGSNMVLSPDFEDDAAWDRAFGAPSTEQKRSGTKSRKLTADGSWHQLVLTHDTDGDPVSVPTAPGRTYYIEVQLRAHAANVTAAGIDLYVTGVSTDNAGVDTWVDSNAIEAAALSSTGFETKSVRVTMPADSVSFRPVVWIPDNIAVGDSFYVDDAVVQDVTEAQSVMSTIIAALGGSGSQFSGLTQALQNIPGANIVGAIAASLISGVLGAGQIPGLDASKIISGVFGTGLIPGLDAAKIVSGVFGGSLIPSLDASKIGSGTFADGLLPGLGALRDAVVQAINGGSSTGNTAAQVKSALQAIPGGNIASAIAAAIVPALDASKITTGTFGAGLIPGLDAAKIISGVFGLAQVPALPASQITSGTFGAGLIPGLDASKIISGVLGTGQIPNLPASIITSGTLAAGLIPTLAASIIGSGTFDAARIPGLDASKIISGTFAQSMVSGLSTIASNASNAVSGLLNFVNQWNGTSAGTLDPNDVTSATASIKAAIAAGYNVAIFSTSNSAWTVPAGTTSLIGCVMNGGGKGANGNATGVGNGGAAGSSGGYLSANLDMTGITPGTSTLNIQIGAAATTAGANGGVTSISLNGGGTLLAGSANANGIASNQGLIGTTSTPGNGGVGGNAAGGTGVGGNGTAGESSGVATGGVGGTGAPAGTGAPPASAKGGNGGNGTSGSVPLCGGAGGGGGGGKNSGSSIQNPQGGNGGNGGYPGGGSGGGGAANNTGGSETPGTSGAPGAGLAALLYK